MVCLSLLTAFASRFDTAGAVVTSLGEYGQLVANCRTLGFRLETLAGPCTIPHRASNVQLM